jgi:hypothetical protein
MLTDSEQIHALPGSLSNETKYKIVMRIAERWAMQAFQARISPHEFCQNKFHSLRPCEDWSDVTKIILTAFVMREYAVIADFLRD